MLSLESPKGHPVGATTFLSRLSSPARHGTVKVKGHQESGLVLEEVAFTAYYPAQVDSSNSRKGLDWVTRPLKLALEGFVRFSGVGSTWITWGVLAPLVYVFGRFIQIPVYPNVPLLNPETSDKKQWPLVIFSHGLGGSRTAYSQICSRIAASGRVVLAIEHRDGTATSCQTRSWDADGKCTQKPIFYLPKDDALPDETRTEPHPLRTDQLLVRHHEVYHTFQVFSRLVSGDTDTGLEIENGGRLTPANWLRRMDGKVPVRLDRMCLAGHSFGGCTVFSILSSKPPEGYSDVPVSHALIYDPWLEPFPTPGPLPVLADKMDGAKPRDDLPRMLVMNSEPFTRWDDHFSELQTAVRKWGPEARLLTLDGNIEERLKDLPPCKFEIRVVGKKKDGRPRREIVGELGDVIVH
ncbi:hypothetical protein PQX77_003537 [Marasmius sp. AFHP31]|nr:hypothetical protein PQX77_003537 [Marasmius sp. AFHP31]